VEKDPGADHEHKGYRKSREIQKEEDDPGGK
jgi:hypothetical protein